jgi:rare lipoprotein A
MGSRGDGLLTMIIIRAVALAGLTVMLGFGLAGCAGMNAEPPNAQEAKAGQSETDEPDEAAKPRARRDRSAKHAPAAAADCGSGRMVRSAFYWQGRRTASGQPFNPEGMTAAHRTLPFGTQLTVTNPRTGKSVVVVVNDRGPFTHGLHLDLSRGAARAIGLTGTGAVCVS